MPEFRDPRARILAAADEERRRLERDLHDGAQSRFVAAAMQLRLLRAQAAAHPELAEGLDSVIAEIAGGIDELRELARGIHPAVLTNRGLPAALESLASRAPLPVEVRATLVGRLPAPVETAAYFAASEALANVAKHAQATHAVAEVRHDGDRLVLEVIDDGCGGATAGAGSGLSGLADRVGGLGGQLEVISPPGAGTRLRVEVPCPPPS